MPARPQPFVIPDSTRFTIMLFPPYGLAWLWLNKDLDAEKKKFGSIGMSLYLMVWLVLVGFVLYFFTPLGVGEEMWKVDDSYNRGDMLRNMQRKQKIKELEMELQKLKKDEAKPNAMLDSEELFLADPGVEAWKTA